MDQENSEHRLLDMLLNECNLQDLTDTCAELLGAPLRFVFHQGEDGFIASSGFDPADALLEQRIIDAQLKRSGEALPTQLRQLMELRHLQPFIAEPELSRFPHRLLLCIASAGRSADGILSLPEKSVRLEEIDPALMRLCARCLALCLHQRRWNHRPVRMRAGMSLLLSGRRSSYQDIVHEVGTQALPEQGHYRLLSVRCLSPQEESTLPALTGQLAHWLKTEWVFEEQQTALLLFESACMPDDLDRRLGPLLRLSGCAACLSPDYTDLMDTSLWRSRHSRLPLFLHAGAGDLVHYADWLDWGLFAESGLAADALDSFVPPALRLLRETDRREGSDYLPTLTAYFENHCSKKQAALMMGLHVNTVSYRLQKIEELSGLLLEDPRTLFILPAALRLMRYQEAITPPSA